MTSRLGSTRQSCRVELFVQLASTMALVDECGALGSRHLWGLGVYFMVPLLGEVVRRTRARVDAGGIVTAERVFNGDCEEGEVDNALKSGVMDLEL